MSLTAISLVPPLLSGANTATTTALLGLHLVAATVMIPTLARSLRTRTDLTIHLRQPPGTNAARSACRGRDFDGLGALCGLAHPMHVLPSLSNIRNCRRAVLFRRRVVA